MTEENDDDDEEEEEEDDEATVDDDTLANKYTDTTTDPMEGLDTSLIIEGGRRRKRARTST